MLREEKMLREEEEKVTTVTIRGRDIMRGA